MNHKLKAVLMSNLNMDRSLHSQVCLGCLSSRALPWGSDEESSVTPQVQ